MNEVNDMTSVIVHAAYTIHRELGPGLLESVYETILARMLQERGLTVRRQAEISFEFAGIRFQDGFRVDLLVGEQIVVELKSVDKLAPVHYKQLLTYLRILNLPVGLLINFGGATFKEGIRRVANTHAPSLPSL